MTINVILIGLGKVLKFILFNGVAYSVYGGFIGTYLYKKFKKQKFQKKTKLIKNVFPVTDDDWEIDVYCSIEEQISGSSPPKTFRKYVHSAEALSLKLISSNLRNQPIIIRTDNFYNISKKNTNLLLLGGGAYNNKSGILMKTMGYHLKFTKSLCGHYYFEDLNTGKTYKCGCKIDTEYDKNGNAQKVPSDYGVILRKPLEGGKVALVLAGIHMHGTLAASHVLINPEFQKKVMEKKYKYFVQLVHTNVDEDGARIDPRDIEWRNLPFYELKY